MKVIFAAVLALGLPLAFLWPAERPEDAPRESVSTLVAASGQLDEGVGPWPPTYRGPPRALDVLEGRAVQVSRGLDELNAFYRSDVEPIERVLRAGGGAPDLARRVSWALIREGAATGLDPWLLAGMLLVENPRLVLEARSFMGAVGLMQVMPFHAGRWDCPRDDLTDVDSNICHGTRVLADALHRSGGDMERALLRYNGCVRGTNTPDCRQYPTRVYAHVGRAALSSGPAGGR